MGPCTLCDNKATLEDHNKSESGWTHSYFEYFIVVKRELAAVFFLIFLLIHYCFVNVLMKKRGLFMIPQCLYPPRVFHLWHSASRAAGVSVFPSPCWRTIMETNHVLLIVLIEEQRKSCTWDETCWASSVCCTLFSPGASATSPVCCSLKCELVHIHHHLLSLFWSIRAQIVRILLYFICLICISEFLIEAN